MCFGQVPRHFRRLQDMIAGVLLYSEGSITMKRKTKTAYLAKIAVLGVLAYIIMFLEFALPVFPSFLKMDFSELVPLVGALALGPVAGMLVELIKNILHWATVSSTGGVGEIANFVVGSAFVMTAGAVYSRHKTKKGAMGALGVAIIAMIAAGAVVNYFITVPFYASVFFRDAGGVDGIVAMSAELIPAIHNKLTLILYAFCPFNLIKGIVLTLITIPLYKKVSPILHRESFKREEK